MKKLVSGVYIVATIVNETGRVDFDAHTPLTYQLWYVSHRRVHAHRERLDIEKWRLQG